MINTITNKINFPAFSGKRCLMMPFIQGDSDSLPSYLSSYGEIIEENYLEKGEMGWLTIDESYVQKGASQRGYNSLDFPRNVHVEVGQINENIPVYCWGGGGWGGRAETHLDPDTLVLIANSIDNTCKIYENIDLRNTHDGDLSLYLADYPAEEGKLLKGGEVAKISIFTPHECMPQEKNGERQFIRIVGQGVTGREKYFTTNPILN